MEIDLYYHRVDTCTDEKERQGNAKELNAVDDKSENENETTAITQTPTTAMPTKLNEKQRRHQKYTAQL